MIWNELFAEGYGVVTTADLLGAGLTWHQIRAAVKRKQIRRISRGRYAQPGELSDFGKARALNGAVSGLSALEHWGVWVPLRVHSAQLCVRVTRTVRRKHAWHPFRRRLSRKTSVRSLSLMVPDSYTGHPHGRGNGRKLQSEPVDEVPTAILVAEEDCTVAELVAICDSAIRKGVDPGVIQDLAVFGGAKLRKAVALLDTGAESGVESLTRAALRLARIKMQTQYELGRMRIDGRVGTSLLIEIDGVQFHGSPEKMRADRRRDRLLHSLGYTVLRFTASEVLDSLDTVVREIHSFTRRGRHRRRVMEAADLPPEITREYADLLGTGFGRRGSAGRAEDFLIA